jgi:hypothetical protein
MFKEELESKEVDEASEKERQVREVLVEPLKKIIEEVYREKEKKNDKTL